MANKGKAFVAIDAQVLSDRIIYTTFAWIDAFKKLKPSENATSDQIIEHIKGFGTFYVRADVKETDHVFGPVLHLQNKSRSIDLQLPWNAIRAIAWSRDPGIEQKLGFPTT